MDLAGARWEIGRSFAAAARVAIAVVTDASGSQTLEVRRDKDKNYYAKSSAVEGTYKVASDVGDALDKSLDDFRNKKLFDFGFSDPSKVELKGVTYAKSGDKWMAGSKTMDNTSVQNLIDKLRDLSAAKFRRERRRRTGLRSQSDFQRWKAGRESLHYEVGRPIFRATRERAEHL